MNANDLPFRYIFGRSQEWLTPEPCARCGVLTRYREVELEKPLCPGPCTVAAWAAYEHMETTT